MIPDTPPRIVILGGGFGGLYAARALKRAPVRVTLVDRRNHHLFLPLLYQVATAGLSPGDIARPIRRILRRQSNAEVILGEARQIDLDVRRVRLEKEALDYDYLILAAGSRVSYFGHDDWSRLAPGLSSIDDALEVRRRVLLAYEAAERETDDGRRRNLLTFVIVGGGPTGVELAGAIGEMARLALARDFRRIDPTTTRVVLVEGGERSCRSFPRVFPVARTARSSTSAWRCEPAGTSHRSMGTGCSSARSGSWPGPCCGPRGSAARRSEPVSVSRPLESGRVKVGPDLSLPGHPEVFVVGDLAAVPDGDGLVPALAPAAIQEGRHAARNIIRSLGDRPRLPFRYVNRGILATVGRAAGVADFGRVRLWGFPAWVAWLLIHIFFLIGFRNRVVVMFQWAWAYLTYERGARLVTGDADAMRRRLPETDRDQRRPSA